MLCHSQCFSETGRRALETGFFNVASALFLGKCGSKANVSRYSRLFLSICALAEMKEAKSIYFPLQQVIAIPYERSSSHFKRQGNEA